MGRSLAGYETEKGNIGVLLIFYKFHFYSLGPLFYVMVPFIFSAVFFSPINPQEIPLQTDSEMFVNATGDFIANQITSP